MDKTFERELALCKKFWTEKQGCTWSECKTCGVIPLLYKLHTGIVYDDAEEIDEIKRSVFENKNNNNYD